MYLLVVRPKVMLLDEPTTGVDPAARRKMWETINAIRRLIPVDTTHQRFSYNKFFPISMLFYLLV